MSSTTLIILLLLLAAVAVIFFRRRKTTPENSDQVNSASAEEGSAAAPNDKAVLEQLRAAGSDLSKPHQIEFSLYFPTEDAARQAAEKLEAEGFEGEMRRAPDLTRWVCLVHQSMVPELSKITATKRRLTALAREFDGQYDGWETKIER